MAAVAIDHVEIIQAPSILTNERDEQISDSYISTVAMDSASMDESSDSGIMSWVDLPGVDLSGEEFTEEFVTKPVQLAISKQPCKLNLLVGGTVIYAVDLKLPTSLPIFKSYPNDIGLSIEPLSTDDPVIPPLNPPSNMRRRKLEPQWQRRRRKRPSQELKKPTECIVCLQTITFNTQLVKLECCNNDLCMDCIKEYITVRVTEGLTYIPCPNPECTKAFTHSTIAKHIWNSDIRNKYERLRLNTEEDGNKKTCPNCCFITERSDLPPFKPRMKSSPTPPEYMISCQKCSFKWCFNCHSPWHEGLSCVSYREGDEQFMSWTKERNKGYIPNCQRCPKCTVYIQRSSGCDFMTCNRCRTNFCYRCGGRFRKFPGLGDHNNELSILGCPYKYLPEQNAKRNIIRGGLLFVKCAVVTIFFAMLVGVVAALWALF